LDSKKLASSTSSVFELKPHTAHTEMNALVKLGVNVGELVGDVVGDSVGD
jgi:hypothetical protein